MARSIQGVVEAVTKSAWRDTVQAADDAYAPGNFTTFAAFEYTSSTDDMGNLHRNVIFTIPTACQPCRSPASIRKTRRVCGTGWTGCAAGASSLAIPHNSNGSNGQMFKLVDWAGDPMDDDYSIQRLRNEPLVEITQIRASDTHPLLSKNDEWADFEIAPYRVAAQLYSEPAGGYVRDAYLRGLDLAAGGVVNPYQFGVIGSSDTHNSATSPDEETCFSKVGMLDGTAELRGSIPASFVSGTLLKWRAPDLLKQVDGRDYMVGGAFGTGPPQAWPASGPRKIPGSRSTRAFRRKETFAASGRA